MEKDKTYDFSPLRSMLIVAILISVTVLNCSKKPEEAKIAIQSIPSPFPDLLKPLE